jgi:hypothetical protein
VPAGRGRCLSVAERAHVHRGWARRASAHEPGAHPPVPAPHASAETHDGAHSTDAPRGPPEPPGGPRRGAGPGRRDARRDQDRAADATRTRPEPPVPAPGGRTSVLPVPLAGARVRAAHPDHVARGMDHGRRAGAIGTHSGAEQGEALPSRRVRVLRHACGVPPGRAGQADAPGRPDRSHRAACRRRRRRAATRRVPCHLGQSTRRTPSSWPGWARRRHAYPRHGRYKPRPCPPGSTSGMPEVTIGRANRDPRRRPTVPPPRRGGGSRACRSGTVPPRRPRARAVAP